MPVPEHLHRIWRAMDERVGHVEPAWWGAVVTEPRFSSIWDTNYARIDAPASDLRLAEVAGALLPRLAAAGADVFHVVTFHPEESAGLLSELSSVGHTLSWDLVMDLVDEPSIRVLDVAVEALEPDERLWDRVERSMELFEIEAPVAAQLRALEEAVASATGKRWFGVRDRTGAVVSLAALVLLDGVGYVDNVATFPQARGKGYATALTAHAAAEARSAGAEHVCLLVDPGKASAVRMYARLGFRQTGRLASTRGPAATVRRSPPDSTNGP